MLTFHHDSETGHARLLIQNPFARAWISPDRRRTPDIRHAAELHDWRLWVQRAPGFVPSVGKSPTQLLIESRLRAWLLQRFRLRLHDPSFEELCRIAQAKHPARSRV